MFKMFHLDIGILGDTHELSILKIAPTTPRASAPFGNTSGMNITFICLLPDHDADPFNLLYEQQENFDKIPMTYATTSYTWSQAYHGGTVIYLFSIGAVRGLL
jgi:hypothetical protein